MYVFEIFNFLSSEYFIHTNADFGQSVRHIETLNALTALATVGATNNFGVMLKMEENSECRQKWSAGILNKTSLMLLACHKKSYLICVKLSNFRKIK